MELLTPKLRLALTVVGFGVLTSIAPVSFGFLQLRAVRIGGDTALGAFTARQEARVAVDGLTGLLTGFAAVSLDVAGDERRRIVEAADLEFRRSQRAIDALIAAPAASLPAAAREKLAFSFETIARNWETVLAQPQSGTNLNVRSFHALRIYEAANAARDILQTHESSVVTDTSDAMTDSFGRLGFASTMLLLVILLGAGVSAWCLFAMFRSTERARTAVVALRDSELELKANNARFEAAIENMAHGLCMFDSDRRLAVSNRRYATLYGVDPDKLKAGIDVETVLKLRLEAGSTPKDSETYYAGRMQTAEKNTSSKSVHELTDGRFIAVSHEPLAEGGWVATHEDVTDKMLAESKISHMAHHDALTGLSNRVVLSNWLDVKLSDEWDNEKFAVLALDLDLFKRVNDTLGHQYGDMLLCQVANRLRECTRDTDLVVRLGGDEFAIVQMAGDQPAAAAALAQRVIDTLNDPFDLDGHQIVIGTSIGVSIAGTDGRKSYQLIKNADLALYRSKAEGRNTFRFFESSMDAKMQARRLLEVDLRKALADDELELVYQPIISVATRKIAGFEALLRWNHPTRGRVAPDDFIPLAEEIGLISAIGEWVLRQACAEATTWPAPIKVAVNLSPVQFHSQTLSHMIISTLAASGLAPSRLELEITEAVLVRDPDVVTETLRQLRATGVRIAMDDFGTGYSSLSYLQKFPFDKIKIDKGFMQKTSTDKDAFAIVKAVISLGKSLGMTITAEGVETDEQFRRLVAEECTEVQGYLFSPARPATEARRLIAKFSGQNLKAVA